MKLSNYFLPLIKENPKEAEITSHNLMLRAGLIRQVTSGIYNWLPLGLAVLQNIQQVIREEMLAIGCNEILMPTTQPADLWQESGRYEAYGKEMLRITDRHERPMLYGPTHEEVVTDLFRKTVKSYKDLPLNLYQIQWKFRDEIRPRFGVMRGREFLMKDGYSFDIDADSARTTYFKYLGAYLKIFKRLGLTAIPVKADPGAIGGELSHEFHILANTGESEVYYDAKFDELAKQDKVDVEEYLNLYSAADEMHDASKAPANVKSARGIEVGHIFNFAQKYSIPMDAEVQTPDGKVAINGGSYGIGVSRIVAALIEANHDDKGILWDAKVAPFKVGLVNIKPKDEASTKIADKLYADLQAAGISVLYDEKDESAGIKFSRMDLIGLPYQIIIGPRLAKDDKAEFKVRASGEAQEIEVDEALSYISS